jgi:FtsP/CotA-like multicopper oxidase with cupredoxin domain
VTNIVTRGFAVSQASIKISRHAIFLLALGVIAVAVPTRAMGQYVKCPANIDLKTFNLHEIVSNGGVLSGTVVLADEQRAQTLPAKNNVTNCLPQLRRFYQDHENLGPLDINRVERPVPGPTLRATLGDVVEITFLNQIDLLDYGNSIDRYENATGDLTAPGAGCDSVTTKGGYPQLFGSPDPVHPIIDSMPNCFHGSSTGNLHFHGTHTNPNSSGDDVFVQVRPSPRVNGVSVVTGAGVKSDFDAFFQQCKSLLQSNSLNQWPVTWDSNPALLHWTKGPDSPGFKSQETLLKEFDASLPPISQTPDPRALWPVDAAQDAAKQWPQYYVGAFPYCFVLPEYPGKNAGTKPRMGQAPGTHWYHAHKHGSTAINVSNGMTGAFIIEGEGYDGALNKYYDRYRTTDKKTPWTRQQITMVVNQLGGIPNLESGSVFSGKSAFAINGQIVPDVSMYPGEVQMWRIINTSSISGFYLPSLPAGFTWRQLAQDGVQFDDGNYQARAERPVFVAAGNRIDLLVQAPANVKPPASATVMVVQGVSVSKAETATPSVPLLNIKLAGSGPAMPLLPHAPPRPDFLKDIAASEIVNKIPRELTFGTANVGGPSEHTINGHKFGEDSPWKVETLNTAEEWKIINTTNGPIDHPFHIHINPFQITAVFDPNQPLMDANNQPVKDKDGKPFGVYVFSTTAPPAGSLHAGQCWVNPNDEKTFVPCAQPAKNAPPYGAKTNIWWDVFPIPGARQDATTKKLVPGYFVMRSRFVDYAGNYVMHCHILAHEDRGMMMTVEVASNGPEPHHH